MSHLVVLPLFLLIWGGRIALLLLLYCTNTPAGGPIVEDLSRFFPHTAVVEAGVAAIVLAISIVLVRLVAPRQKLFSTALFSLLPALYLVAAAVDDQLMRWLGQHLTFSYLRTYANAGSDLELVGKIFLQEAPHFLAATAVVITALLLFYRISYRAVPLLQQQAWRGKGSVLLLVLMVVGLSSPSWFAPSKMRWKRIRPVAHSLIDEMSYSWSHRNPPSNLADGIAVLGGDPHARYPFWKEVPNEIENYTQFRQRPFDQQPDIVLLTIETLRGWSADLRLEENCQRLPNICRLASMGSYFPNAQSVGYPSIEGLLGTQVGIWSHPSKTFLSDRSSIRIVALPDILKKAGYYRIVLTATEPSFDNLHPWFARWFDFSEYNPQNSDDLPIANRFRELYRNRPADKPLYFNWMSTTTHIPFLLPEEYGPNPSDLSERYLRTLVYMDSAVGVVLREIEAGPRSQETIVVLTGDHAIPNSVQKQHEEELGAVHYGYTWVPLIISGPGVPQGELENRTVSHSSLPVTLLQLLDLEVSHHFVGANLLNRESLPPVFSFRNGGYAMSDSSIVLTGDLSGEGRRYYQPLNQPLPATADPVEGFRHPPFSSLSSAMADSLAQRAEAAANAWQYIVDQNRLTPPDVSIE